MLVISVNANTETALSVVAMWLFILVPLNYVTCVIDHLLNTCVTGAGKQIEDSLVMNDLLIVLFLLLLFVLGLWDSAKIIFLNIEPLTIADVSVLTSRYKQQRSLSHLEL